MVAEVARALPRGLRNNNPGNIDRVAGVRWQGQADDQSGDPRFVVFTDAKWGIRAICRTLITYQDKRQAADGSKIDTVAEIVDRWAPPVENNTGAYAEHVAKLLSVGTDDTIDVYDWATMRGLVLAIIEHENGFQPFDNATIDSGLIAAGLQAPNAVVKKGQSKLAKAVGVAAGAVSTAGGTVLTMAPDIVQTLPAARASYEQTTTALAPVAEALPWLRIVVTLAGLTAMGAVLFLAMRERKLRERVE